MGLLAYSTTVPVDRTVSELQKALAQHGARSVLTEFSPKGDPVALSFLIPTAFGERAFRLPVDVAATHRALSRQAEAGVIPRKFGTPGQALRVAWRVIKTWLDAQLALIETEMVRFDQIMLPYLVVDRSQRTLYEVMVEQRLALPEPREE